MPRQARLDTPGTLHHVIARGIEKRRIVDDKVDRDNFVLLMGGRIQGKFSRRKKPHGLICSVRSKKMNSYGIKNEILEGRK